MLGGARLSPEALQGGGRGPMTDEVEKIKYCHVPLILRHVAFHFPSLRLRCVSSLTVYHILISTFALLSAI